MKSAINYTDAFFDLEPPIRDLERAAMLAFEKAMAVDHADAETDMAVFTATQVLEKARDLRRQYEQTTGYRDRSAVVPFQRRA